MTSMLVSLYFIFSTSVLYFFQKHLAPAVVSEYDHSDCQIKCYMDLFIKCYLLLAKAFNLFA